VAGLEEFDSFVIQGAASREVGNHGGALYFFMKAAELRPADVSVRLEMAQSLVDLNRLNEAESIYRNILAAAPDSTAALVGMAYLERKRGNHDRSGEWFGFAAGTAPENLDIQAELATELLALSEYRQAELVYCKILEKDPFHFSGRIGFGAALRRRGRRSEALSIFRDLLNAHPDSIEVLYELANSLVDMRKLDEARDVYRQILERQPDGQRASSELDSIINRAYGLTMS
jgi:tetratricopeptide (TPR) repeat protein